MGKVETSTLGRRRAGAVSACTIRMDERGAL